MAARHVVRAARPITRQSGLPQIPGDRLGGGDRLNRLPPDIDGVGLDSGESFYPQTSANPYVCSVFGGRVNLGGRKLRRLPGPLGQVDRRRGRWRGRRSVVDYEAASVRTGESGNLAAAAG